MDKLHITHVLEATGGGARKHLRLIIPELIKRGHRIQLVVSTRRAEPDFQKDLDHYLEMGCNLHLLDMGREPALSDWKAVQEFKEILKHSQPQIIHSHCAKAGLVARMAARGMPGKTVHTPHSYFFQDFRSSVKVKLAVRMERFLNGHIFCISDAELKLINQHQIAKAKDVSIGYNGLPADFNEQLGNRADIREKLGLTEDHKAIGVFARLVRRKGHHWLLDAIAGLDANIKEKLKVFIYGEGDERESLESHVINCKLQNIVRFMGYVPRAEKDLPAMDLGILPSFYEGLSYQLLETLAAGKPLIASDIPGNRFSYDNNPIVYNELFNQPQLREQITSCLHDEYDAEAARKWVQNYFALDKQVDALMKCYEKVLSPAGAEI